ncbi:MAG: adenosylcobinamide-GDP ribazoletransferase [Steroidobacteraceae bacterium]|nr:adenosylcobinamide-GDP ribazoletransferase [Steroidobacteraceae bacterium]
MKRQFVLFLVAIQFLTRLPVPRLDRFEEDWLSRSARYFPVVGVLVGSITVGVWWLSSACFAPAVAAGLMIAASLIVTGALHEDGFADVCDGFGGAATRDGVLAIMKDSRIGAYGAIGIAVMLGLKWTVLASMPRSALALTVISASMVSRWCTTGLIWRLPYVRADADAKSKPLANSLSTGNWLLSGVLGAVALVPAAWMASPSPTLPVLRALTLALAFASASTILAASYFKSRIGGYTGDCLGATQQLAELSFLLTALAAFTAVR